MHIKDLNYYNQFLEGVEDFRIIELEIKESNLKIDEVFLNKFLDYVKSFSLVESPNFLLLYSEFQDLFRSYYISYFNMKKQITFDPIYKSYFDKLMSKVELVELIFSEKKIKFICELKRR